MGGREGRGGEIQRERERETRDERERVRASENPSLTSMQTESDGLVHLHRLPGPMPGCTRLADLLFQADKDVVLDRGVRLSKSLILATAWRHVGVASEAAQERHNLALQVGGLGESLSAGSSTGQASRCQRRSEEPLHFSALLLLLFMRIVNHTRVENQTCG